MIPLLLLISYRPKADGRQINYPAIRVYFHSRGPNCGIPYPDIPA